MSTTPDAARLVSPSSSNAGASSAVGAARPDVVNPSTQAAVNAHLLHNENVRRTELTRLGRTTQLDVDVATDHLGTVRVEAADRLGGLHLKLSSDDVGVRQLLNDRSAELRSAAGADNVSVEPNGSESGRSGPGGHGSGNGPANGSGNGSEGRQVRQSGDLADQPEAGQQELSDEQSPTGPGERASLDGRVDVRI